MQLFSSSRYIKLDKQAASIRSWSTDGELQEWPARSSDEKSNLRDWLELRDSF